MLKKMLIVCIAVLGVVCSNISITYGKNTNPVFRPLGINARVAVPGTNPTEYVTRGFRQPYCYHYESAYFPEGTWNGKFTKEDNEPISNSVTGDLTFPVLAILHYNGQRFLITITAADVDRYYDEEKYPVTGGYTKISGASMAMNCHGFSTGLGYWINDFDVIAQNDYRPSITPSALTLGSIKGNDNNSHTIKIIGITKTTINCVSTYRVIKTREKFRASGIYEKAVTDEVYPESGTVGYIFYNERE
jgi:hypothetical protein